MELNVPDSQHNYDLGNFMINLTFKNALNETVGYSSRPVNIYIYIIYSLIWKKNIEIFF